MARDWPTLFESWCKPASETEETKASRAADMIREAIREHHPLKDKRISVYATGSYRNNTNTRTESDIDIAAVLQDCYFWECPAGKPPQAADLGHTTGVQYGLDAFRADVGVALARKFGERGVTRGKKAFDVHANSVRLDADVSAFLQHRRYTGQRNADGSWHYIEGAEMRGASGERIINWHDQHYASGVAKNNRTGRRFKRVARILKRLRDDMRANGTPASKAAAEVPSFLLECLAYNATDDCYQRSHLHDDVRAVVAQTWQKTKPESPDLAFLEVNDLKWLFAATQPWTKARAHQFLLSVWHHVGFDS